MKNFYHLNFQNSFLRDEIFYSPLLKKTSWTTNKVRPRQFLNNDCLKWLEIMQIKPYTHVNLFCGLANKHSDIHIDQHKWAINFVWGSAKSEMIWYKPKTAGTSKKTTAGTDYIKWDEHDVEIIEFTTDFSVPILVKVDQAHRVNNLDTNDRWCLSIRGYPETDWESIVEHLRPYII